VGTGIDVSNEQTTKKTAWGTEISSVKEGLNNASINHCFDKASGIDRKDLI
jgi:hypothetical protein